METTSPTQRRDPRAYGFRTTPIRTAADLPHPRTKRKRRNAEERRQVAQRVATKEGAPCGFGHACKFGTACRGEHTIDELAFFSMREHRVVDLERKAGCAYCDAGICEFGPSCRGQTALRRSKTTEVPASRDVPSYESPPLPRVKLRKRGRKRPRGKKKGIQSDKSDRGVEVHHAQRGARQADGLGAVNIGKGSDHAVNLRMLMLELELTALTDDLRTSHNRVRELQAIIQRGAQDIASPACTTDARAGGGNARGNARNRVSKDREQVNEQAEQESLEVGQMRTLRQQLHEGARSAYRAGRVHAAEVRELQEELKVAKLALEEELREQYEELEETIRLNVIYGGMLTAKDAELEQQAQRLAQQAQLLAQHAHQAQQQAQQAEQVQEAQQVRVHGAQQAQHAPRTLVWGWTPTFLPLS